MNTRLAVARRDLAQLEPQLEALLDRAVATLREVAALRGKGQPRIDVALIEAMRDGQRRLAVTLHDLAELEKKRHLIRDGSAIRLRFAQHKTWSGSGAPAPPTGASFLLDLLLAKADRYAIPGDMEEEFASKLAKYGPAGARLWFWGETGRTIATRNPICRWILVSGLARLVEWIFRQIGS